MVASGGLSGNVFLTGGTGTLGLALLLLAQEEAWPCRFTVFSRDAVRQQRARALFPQHHYVLGDVRDLERLTLAMAGHDLVIHAAAIKHIPDAEANPAECVGINVTGSLNVVLAAARLGIRRVVGISTDKAVAPLNIYGMSKAVMERLFQGACAWSLSATMARYGNVVSSNGSVIPYWRRLAAEGKPLPVTDMRMTRFWMSAEDAVRLIVVASREEPGCIVIPQARAMKIVDVARVAGGSSAQLVDVGMRPGEKVHEDLVSEQEIAWLEQRQGYHVLRPMTGPAVHQMDAWRYVRSNAPDGGWLEPEEMAALIAAADERERWLG